MIGWKLITEDDLAFLNVVRNECSEFLSDSRKFTLEETKKWFEEKTDDYYIVFDDDVRIGYIRTSHLNTDYGSMYIGMDLHKDYRGKGLAYETYIKFIPFIFEEMCLDTLILEVLVTNERAMKLYHKLGFKKIGVKKIDRDGSIDSIIMRLDKEIEL